MRPAYCWQAPFCRWPAPNGYVSLYGRHGNTYHPYLLSAGIKTITFDMATIAEKRIRTCTAGTKRIAVHLQLRSNSFAIGNWTTAACRHSIIYCEHARDCHSSSAGEPAEDRHSPHYCRHVTNYHLQTYRDLLLASTVSSYLSDKATLATGMATTAAFRHYGTCYWREEHCRQNTASEQLLRA